MKATLCGTVDGRPVAAHFPMRLYVLVCPLCLADVYPEPPLFLRTEAEANRLLTDTLAEQHRCP